MPESIALMDRELDALSGQDWNLIRALQVQAAAEFTTRRQQMKRDLSEPQREALGHAVISEILSTEIQDRAQRGRGIPTAEQEEQMAEVIFRFMFRMGRLQPLLDDDRIENIEISGHNKVWVTLAGEGIRRVAPIADSNTELLELIQHIVTRMGRTERALSEEHPMVHMRLPDGSRFAATYDVTEEPEIVIRRHRLMRATLGDLAEKQMLTPDAAEFLGGAVRARKNIVLCGPPGCGKTTLLRAACGEISPGERVATIESAYELQLQADPERWPRLLAMESRPGVGEKGPDGRHSGEVTLTDLIEQSLLMNPRRIIIGEVRDASIGPMIEVMHSAEGGSMSTLHTRSVKHGVSRMVGLLMRTAQLGSAEVAERLIADAVDLLVFVGMRDLSARGGGIQRHVSHIVELNGYADGGVQATEVFTPGADGRAMPNRRPVEWDDYADAGTPETLFDGGRWQR